MDRQDKRTWAEINLRNLEHNYNEIRHILPDGCHFAGICKADAYGHGALRVVRKLEELGADCLAVSCIEEAAQLRNDGRTLPILILAPSPAFLAPEIAALPAEQTIGDLSDARAMSEALEGSELTLRCHLKLETGMGRTGLDVSSPELTKTVLELLNLPNLEFVGVLTHFAVSDEADSSFTSEQTASFMATVDRLERISGRSLGLRHCANSGAVVNYKETAFDMVRPGLLLYGVYPNGGRGGMDLRPVMQLMTRVYAITEHKAGDSISYGRIYTCERDMRVAVIPVGYADGLHRSLSDKMDVLINGKRARQIGRICMDMCMIDVTDVPDVRLGDIVTIFGEELPVDEQAKKAETISYELLCAVSPRVPRIYLDNV